MSCVSDPTRLKILKLYRKFFTSYKTKSGGSFPHNLFRILEGMSEKDRTPFLVGAVGTHGLKQAKIATRTKRQRVFHHPLSQVVGISTEEVYNIYEEECEKLNEFSDENISTENILNRIPFFIKDLIANKTRDDIQIDISVMINGKEVSKNSKIESIIKTTKETIRITMNKKPLSQE